MPFILTIKHIHHLERRSYRIVKELGRGEYGIVVHAEKKTRNDLPSQVALKLTEKFETFQSELRVFNLLGSHPNIVAHRGSFSDRLIHVIELEYLRGQTLLDFLLTNGPLEELLARHYFAQLVSGMLHSHLVAGVAHRDIKAENLMICGQDLFILDWGMGLQITPGQYLFEACGSPDYVAPELYLRIPYRGTEVDVWAMGVVLYAMITGKFPFNGDDPSEIAIAVCRDNYWLPSDVSPALTDLLARMLSKDPGSRTTVREIQDHPWVAQMPTIGSPCPKRGREATVPDSKRNSHRTDLVPPIPNASERSLQTISL
ncbi:MAG: protein kinase, partial [archaeon]|nr:protein kinase [archaeon]